MKLLFRIFQTALLPAHGTKTKAGNMRVLQKQTGQQSVVLSFQDWNSVL
jgi:hypothetical protein